MKVIINTGYVRMYDQKDNHLEVGGILRELAVHTRRFLDLYENRNDVLLRICLPLDMWQDFIKKYPFANNKLVEFLDYQSVLGKQGLEKNIYWYDALRFQVFSTVEDSDDVLEYWIDGDALILREDFLDLCLENEDKILVPDNYYPWTEEKLQRLHQYQKYFNSCGLSAEPLPELYTNTGTMMGGPSKYVKFISSKILEIERGMGLEVQPSAEVLEYTSCQCIGELCKNYSIPLRRVEDTYVWHWTGHRLPSIIYDTLGREFPEDRENFYDYYNTVTKPFRTRFIDKLFTEFVKPESIYRNLDNWPELAVQLYGQQASSLKSLI